MYGDLTVPGHPFANTIAGRAIWVFFVLILREVGFWSSYQCWLAKQHLFFIYKYCVPIPFSYLTCFHEEEENQQPCIMWAIISSPLATLSLFTHFSFRTQNVKKKWCFYVFSLLTLECEDRVLVLVWLVKAYWDKWLCVQFDSIIIWEVLRSWVTSTSNISVPKPVNLEC